MSCEQLKRCVLTIVFSRQIPQCQTLKINTRRRLAREQIESIGDEGEEPPALNLVVRARTVDVIDPMSGE